MANPRARNTPPPNPLMKFLPIVVILIGVAIAAYFFIPRGGNTPAPTANAPGAPGAAAQPNAAAPAPAPELTKEQLLKEAGTAFREQRYVAPQGNNALEYYLRVLDKEPTNAVAKDALREMFPFATPIVETDINGGNLDEATRVIDLLAKADPGNYTLTILRGKLDAKKKQAEAEAAKQAAAAAAAAAKAAAPATAPAAPANPAAAPAAETAAATPAPAAPTPAAPRTNTPAASTATAAATPPPASAAPAPSGESSPAQLVKSAAPEYPRDAFIKHQEGWVEVEFTVTPEGTVSNAAVAGANPSRVFDQAALRAVQKWTFKPKMENGKAVEERMKRRIEFKLGAG